MNKSNCMKMLTEQEMRSVTGGGTGAWLAKVLRSARDAALALGSTAQSVCSAVSDYADDVMRRNQELVSKQIEAGGGIFNGD